VREAIHRLRRSLRNINWVHVENAVQVLDTGTTGDKVTLPSGLELRLNYDHFTVALQGYTEPLPDRPWVSGQTLRLQLPGSTELPGSPWQVWSCVVARDALIEHDIHHADLWEAYLDYDAVGADLWLRSRRSGDRFWPQGLGHKPTTLNSFMINVKIPRAWRDRVPLLVDSEQVLWIAGWRIDERAKVTDATSRVLHVTFSRSGAEG
jgi:tRNA(Ile)-lysidine synthase